MVEFLQSKGWLFSSACGCVPKKYKYRHYSYAGYIMQVCPARSTWVLTKDGKEISRGQQISLEEQYGKIFS